MSLPPVRGFDPELADWPRVVAEAAGDGKSSKSAVVAARLESKGRPLLRTERAREGGTRATGSEASASVVRRGGGGHAARRLWQ